MILRALIRRTMRSTSGVAMTEFALGAPVLMFASLYGAEEVNYVLVNMKINQLASHVADNASRVGDPSQLKFRKIYESDINDLLMGAQIQAGKSINVFKYGRVIVTSLQGEPNPSGGPPLQYIGWQRCRGAKVANSSYGTPGNVPADGMGPSNAKVTAEERDAVIFVEIRYSYQPFIIGSFIPNKEIVAISAFNVRDNRDISQIYQRSNNKPDPVQGCSTYAGEMTVSSNGVVT